MSDVFRFGTFFVPIESRWMFAWGISSLVFKKNLIYPFDPSVKFLSVHLSRPKTVLFPSSFVPVQSPPTKWNFLSLFWKVLFCLYCLTLSQYLLSLPFSANIFYPFLPVLLAVLSAVVFWSIYSTGSLCIFPFWVLSLVLQFHYLYFKSNFSWIFCLSF